MYNSIVKYIKFLILFSPVDKQEFRILFSSKENLDDNVKIYLDLT